MDGLARKRKRLGNAVGISVDGFANFTTEFDGSQAPMDLDSRCGVWCAARWVTGWVGLGLNGWVCRYVSGCFMELLVGWMLVVGSCFGCVPEWVAVPLRGFLLLAVSLRGRLCPYGGGCVPTGAAVSLRCWLFR